MAPKTTSTSKRLVSKNVRKKGLIERSPLGGVAKGANKFMSSIKGIFVGIIFLLIGFLLIWGSVRWINDYAAVVESLPFSQADTLSSDAGMVKIKGTPEIIGDFDYEYTTCIDEFCDEFGQETQINENILYYSASFERYEQYEETEKERETIDRGGEEVTEVYEVTKIKEDWKEKSAGSKWAKFEIGNVVVNAQDARNKLDLQKQTISNVMIPNVDDDYYVKSKEDEASSKVGDTRLVLSTAPADKDLIVVGKISNGEMDSGEPFIVSDMSHEELLESLKSDEKSGRLMLRIGAWVMLTLGFLMILGPILTLADFNFGQFHSFDWRCS
jgi:hypothetical protein